ncbi:thioesterase II family protein [Dictyobacter kobayashii]|uniref:Thioesterase n=1 Tax=Dictyobacter kobayashii TaxID=2014872 RepID=A0A402ALJ5_9CHLR|nr:thioesterase domain-containing protein [Dictyobacter kobayashii]GCE20002.1 thioesterase [Dictyobacter kobayashii]
MLHSSWIVSKQAHPKNRLFCFPYAGGGASIYRLWSQTLPPEVVEVCPIYLPGRETRIREEPFYSLDALIPPLVQALNPYLHEPFQIFGHSMGALIGFELTRQLRRQQLPTPTHLFVSGHRAPQIPRPGSQTWQKPDPEFIESLKTLGGTPDAVLQNAELMQLLLPTLRADFALNETYQYQPEPPLKILMTVFGGSEDKEVDPTKLQEWQKQTHYPITKKIFPGGHFYLHTHQPLLTQAIASHYI